MKELKILETLMLCCGTYIITGVKEIMEVLLTDIGTSQ